MSGQDRRRFARHAVDAPSRMRRPQSRPVGVTVDDISQSGIRFQCPFPLEIGLEVWVEVPNVGEKRALVAWHRGPTHGCEFIVPLRHQDVARAFAELDLVKVKWGRPISFPGIYAVLSILLLVPMTLIGAAFLTGRW